jgi:glucose dehydrogenase
VALIETRRVPDLFLHLGGTHVHHLNYGIFLLAGTGAWLLFHPPATLKAERVAATLYGIGLALTFDEFGMWLHLGGSYWQRASFDSVVVILAILGLLASAPALRALRPRHWAVTGVLALAVIAFAILLWQSLQRAESTLERRLERIEEAGPK